MNSAYLISDYEDFYDHAFPDRSIADIEFRRVFAESPRRIDMFRLLRKMGLKVPVFGKVKYMTEKTNEFYNQYGLKVDNTDNLVIYLNEKHNGGQEKVLLPFYDAVKKYPNHISSLHIPCKLPSSSEMKSVSHRQLQIGGKFIWMRYSSDDNWRSNEGNVKVEILKVSDSAPKFDQPIYAIDYIYSPDESLYAIDYNIAPMLKGTGLESILQPEEIVRLIQERIKIPFNNEYST